RGAAPAGPRLPRPVPPPGYLPARPTLTRKGPAMTLTCRPALEALEDRFAPAVFGVPWPDPDRLTLSFVPDGTSVGGHPSDLFALLGRQPAWQPEALRAFQASLRPTDIDARTVPDGGQPLGDSGAVQQDARFGDIRIAAYPMDSDVLAVASPFDPLAGTWSGDVKLNATRHFGVAGPEGAGGASAPRPPWPGT